MKCEEYFSGDIPRMDVQPSDTRLLRVIKIIKRWLKNIYIVHTQKDNRVAIIIFFFKELFTLTASDGTIVSV